MTYPNYADLARPNDRRLSIAYDITLVLIASFALALSAQVTFYLPISPVPVTGQTFVVLLIGALLGSRRGPAAIIAYITQGLIGMPFFHHGGATAAHFFGPTCGYMLGFILAAYLVGKCCEKGLDRRFATILPAMALGMAAIYLCGLMWLIPFTGISNVLAAGLLPFIPGCIVKTLAATAVLLCNVKKQQCRK